jgi:hypothetical protein
VIDGVTFDNLKPNLVDAFMLLGDLIQVTIHLNK